MIDSALEKSPQHLEHAWNINCSHWSNHFGTLLKQTEAGQHQHCKDPKNWSVRLHQLLVHKIADTWHSQPPNRLQTCTLYPPDEPSSKSALSKSRNKSRHSSLNLRNKNEFNLGTAALSCRETPASSIQAQFLASSAVSSSKVIGRTN